MSIEIIENTRELTIVKVNNILITQKLDSYSTKENAKAVLTIKDLNSNEVEEIEIETSYKAGEYITTLFSDSVKLGTFSSDYDPLEPGALREINKISGDSVASFVSANSLQSPLVRRFWWDGVVYICGTNVGDIDLPFARPCHNHHRISSFEDVTIRGTRMQHFQLNRGHSQSLLRTPPIIIGGAIGIIIGTVIKPGLGTAIGGIIGTVIGAFIEQHPIRRNLECDRGNIWGVVHRELFHGPIPALSSLPRFIRVGRLNIWDRCVFTFPIPAWRDS